MASLTLRDLIGYYEFHNRTEGKSPKTIVWYSESLGAFEGFLLRTERSTLVEDLGEPEVRATTAASQRKAGAPPFFVVVRGERKIYGRRPSAFPAPAAARSLAWSRFV